jgi:hypothetical protein
LLRHLNEETLAAAYKLLDTISAFELKRKHRSSFPKKAIEIFYQSQITRGKLKIIKKRS